MTTSVFIFGASGDLAARLLYPALHRLESHGRLDAIRLIGVALEEMSEDQFRAHVATTIGDEAVDGEIRDRFLKRFTYHRSDLSVDSLTALKPLVGDVNVYYLALPPGVFAEAATAIAGSGITDRATHRLVVEKPFGTSQATAAALDRRLHAHWDESQIFRIDHFLGKETVQNLSVMRFANRVIEPLLCAAHVDHVQITVAETLGVEGRYRYYDGIGALRDMVQNHLMQLFCLAAMDPPAVWDPDILRNHKVELLRSVKRPGGDIDDWAVRGQYSAGRIADRDVPEYRQEPGIPPDSTTETFAAVRLQVDNWRWQGGPSTSAPVSDWEPRFRKSPIASGSRQPSCSGTPPWGAPNRTGWSFESINQRVSICSFRQRHPDCRWSPSKATCTPIMERPRRPHRPMSSCSSTSSRAITPRSFGSTKWRWRGTCSIRY